MKKILVIDPYINTLGGGEEHILSIAKVMEDHGYQITLACENPLILQAIEGRFKLGIKNINVLKKFNTLSALGRYSLTRSFDMVLYATDGSYFASGASSNYIFSMYPKEELYKPSVINSLKLHNYEYIANSNFTKKYIEKWVNKPVHVITPYLNSDFYKPINKNKQNIIISVGRFFGHLHSKRQDVLIDAFAELQKKMQGWKLVLIGGLKDEDREFYDYVVRKAEMIKNVMIIPNAPYSQMMDYFNKATLYWHAAGFGLDEENNLDAVEHFGITPLEGMARGCIVFAYNAGGQRDIIKSHRNGYLYDSIDELVAITQEIMTDKDLIKKIQYESVSTAKRFQYADFKKNCEEVLRI